MKLMVLSKIPPVSEDFVHFWLRYHDDNYYNLGISKQVSS